MAKNSTMAQVRTDVLEMMDTPSGGRFSDTLLDRFINASRDKLHAIIAESDDDDWLTYCVGVEVKPSVLGGQTIPLPSFGTSAPGWWKVPIWTDGSDTAWSPNVTTGEGPGVDAPGFHRLRKVQILNDYTAESDTSGRLEPVYQWAGKAKDLQRVGLDGLNRNADAKAWTYTSPPCYRLMGGNTLWLDRPSDADAGFLIWYVADLLDVATGGSVNLQPCWLEWIIYDVCTKLRYRDKEDAGEFVAERQNLEQLIREQNHARDEYGPPTIRRVYEDAGELGDQEYRDLITHGNRW